MRRILVVDDDAVNRLVLLAMLDTLVEFVDEAADGIDALRRIGDQTYDMILLDIHMPDLDGVEVAARVRATPGPNQIIPIIAVTGDVTRSLDDYRQLGFDGLIEKPISLQSVRRGLSTRRAVS